MIALPSDKYIVPLCILIGASVEGAAHERCGWPNITALRCRCPKGHSRTDAGRHAAGTGPIFACPRRHAGTGETSHLARAPRRTTKTARRRKHAGSPRGAMPSCSTTSAAVTPRKGRWRMLLDDPNDGFDIVQWIGKQPWSNGKVGTFGTSYVGGTQHALACAGPPHLAVHDPGRFRVQYRHCRHPATVERSSCGS